MLNFIHTKKAPKAIGPYSQAILYENFLFISGQIALDPETGFLINENIEKETDRVLQNILAIITEAGFKKEDIIKCEIFVVNLKDNFQKINQIYENFFEGHKPVRQTLGISELPKGAMVEISAVGCKAIE